MGYHILFIGWEFPPRGGGVGTYMWNMARVLSRLGHHIVFMTGRMEGMASTDKYENLTVYRCYEQGEHRQRKFVNKVLKIVQEHKIDWIEGADYLGECHLLLKEKDFPPIVIKAHSCDALSALRRAESMYAWQRPLVFLALFRNIRKLLDERACLGLSRHLLAPSWRIVDELIKDRLIKPVSIGVIPNTLDSISESGGEEYHKPTILFPGKISIGKGIEYLQPILGSLDIPGLRVEIAGDDTYARGIGSLKKWLKEKLAQKQIDAEFLGKLSSDQMKEAYQRSWVVILPTKWDNFPNVVLESMQLGKPIVTSPFGGMVEMLEGTRAPVAVPQSLEFPNAVQQLLLNKSLRDKVGRSLKDKFEKAYAPERVAQSYLEHITHNVMENR